MKMILFVIYKEFLEFKNNRRLHFQLPLQSLFYGSFFPIITWAVIRGILPTPGPELAKIEALKAYSINLYPLLLPFLIAIITSLLTLHTFSAEVEHRTIEALYTFPILWYQIVIGKFFFFLTISLLCGYMIVSLYWVLTFIVMPSLQVSYLLDYLVLLVPAVSLYSTTASLFVSAKTRNTRLAYVYSGVLTWGLFLSIFFLSWALRFSFNEKFIWILSLILTGASMKIFYLILKINPEKLLTM